MNIRFSLPLAFLVLTISQFGVAHAQADVASPPAGNAVKVDKPLRADVAAPAGAVLSPDAANEEHEAVVVEARRRFDRGVQLYTEQDYSLALIEFERAYELVSNYRVLYNIGQVSIQLRRYARARTALEQYLSVGEGEVEEDRLSEVQADIEMLKARTALLLVKVNVAKAQVFLDGQAIGLSPLTAPVMVDAGTHVVEVKRGGFTTKEKAITLAGGDDLSLEMSLELERSTRTVEKQTIVVRHDGSEALSTWKWVGWGTSGVMAVGAVATGIFGLNAASQLEDLRNTAGVSHEELASAQSRARRMFVASDILAATTVVAAGVSLYLTVGVSQDDDTLDLAVGPGSLQLSGTF